MHQQLRLPTCENFRTHQKGPNCPFEFATMMLEWFGIEVMARGRSVLNCFFCTERHHTALDIFREVHSIKQDSRNGKVGPLHVVPEKLQPDWGTSK